jgi:tetratricopeptide (TPR) repeat protein
MADMFFYLDFGEAKASIEKAQALDPNSALARDTACVFAYEMGRSSEAIAECRKAVELEPLSPLYNYDLANAYYLAREYDQSLQQARRTLEIDPRYSEAIKMIGYVYEVTGNYNGAIEQWVRNEQVLGNEQRTEELRLVFEKTGYRGYLRKDAKDKEVESDYYDAACDYAMLGEKDASLVALARAVAAGQQIDYLKLDPDLDNIRSDPRYADLLRRIGLPQ